MIESQVTRREVITDGRQDAKEGPKDGSELRTEDSNKVSANNEDGKGGKGNSVDASLRRRSGRERIASRGPLLSSSIFQRDMATATAKSREETPGCLRAEEVIRLGIRTASSHGILCTPPNLPLVGNSFAPMNGDCIFTCFCHINDPNLSGLSLKQAALELRIKAVGSAIETLKHFNDEQWGVLQAIATGDQRDALSREEIKLEMEKYMESGQYSGDVGDLLPQLAADYMEQPLLIVEVEKSKVTNMSIVEPGGIFGGQDSGCPAVVVRQLGHYEPLLIAAKERGAAMEKYKQWKDAGRVGVSEGRVSQANACNNYVL